jgi:hypothetical protein
MTDNEPTVKSRIGLPSDAYRLGVDARGVEHYHSAQLGRIWLVDGDDVDTRDLDGVPVSEWVRQIRAKIGAWETVQPVEQTSGLAGIVEDVCEEVA